MRYEVVPATADHAAELARRMRVADRNEVRASHHATPRQAVTTSMQLSREAHAGLADGRLVCMFGVAATALSRQGSPWMLATPALRHHGLPFLRRNQRFVNEWRVQFDVLSNFVDARNVRAIRWLRWLGFEIEPAAPYGLDGLPFHRFSTGVLTCKIS